LLYVRVKLQHVANMLELLTISVQTLEYRYISKLPMKTERIWSYGKETTSHLQNKLTKNIPAGTQRCFNVVFRLNFGHDVEQR
jgi:hypothetical protein